MEERVIAQDLVGAPEANNETMLRKYTLPCSGRGGTVGDPVKHCCAVFLLVIPKISLVCHFNPYWQRSPGIHPPLSVITPLVPITTKGEGHKRYAARVAAPGYMQGLSRCLNQVSVSGILFKF